MSLRQIDLTTALRPTLWPEETLVFVQDAVGLYEGKIKLRDYQDGHIYLTSHRACYVDNLEARHRAVAVDLKEVDRCELYTGFLKSSPKVTLFSKRRNNGRIRGDAVETRGTSLVAPSLPDSDYRSPISPVPSPSNSATWVCPICSFSNAVPPNFDPALANHNTSLPPCLSCGIKPPLLLMIKAAVAATSKRDDVSASSRLGMTSSSAASQEIGHSRGKDVASYLECPRCTFKNHSSLFQCEICGAPLNTSVQVEALRSQIIPSRHEPPVSSSSMLPHPTANPESIKFSFRAGGEKIFHERLKGALIQRKWLLQSAPRLSSNGLVISNGQHPAERLSAGIVSTGVGITGLERRDLQTRQDNEIVLGNAFEDLAALMASARQIIAIAERLVPRNRSSVLEDGGETMADPGSLLAQLNLTTTKEMLASAGISPATGTSLYLTELSRQLAEYLTDDRTGILKQEGGIMSLVDLWAVFNRARGGVELVSPSDFAGAVNLFEKLRLPVRLRTFKSGLVVVQGWNQTEERTINSIISWLGGGDRQRTFAMSTNGTCIWGHGVTALEAAEHFGWSVGVATEELELAEDRGALCRDISLEGIRFWVNWFSRT